MEILQKLNIAAIPSFNVEQLSNDPHLRDRGIIQNVSHPVIKEIPVLGVPWMINGVRSCISPGPLLGEANQYIFGELLGLSDEEIKRFEENKVIY